jgi:hypothetical protein
MNAEATAVRDTKAIGTAIPGRWSTPPSDAAIRAVVRLGLIPLHLLATRIGRRLMATAVLSMILVGAVSALYDHADSPASPPRPLDTAVRAAASKPGTSGKAGTAGGQAAGAAKSAGGSRVTSLASVAAARPAKDAQSAAVAWYANRVHVSPDRVQALQQQRVNGTTTKVLVMAQVSETNVPTAFVTVRRAGGGWKVS